MKMIFMAVVSLLIVSCGSSDKKATDTKIPETQKVLEKSADKKATTAATAENAIKCTVGKDNREIAIASTKSGRCEVLYTKAGETKKIAEGNAKTDFCQRTADKIKSNLESAGFTCK